MEQITTQKRLFEKTLLREERDKFLKVKQQKIHQIKQYQVEIDRKINQQAIAVQQEIHNQELRDKEQKRYQFVNDLHKAVAMHKQNKISQTESDLQYRQQILTIDSDHLNQIKAEQEHEEVKKQEFRRGLELQIQQNKILKTQMDQLDKQWEAQRKSGNDIFEQLRCQLELQKMKECNKCNHVYDEKGLTKIVQV